VEQLELHSRSGDCGASSPGVRHNSLADSVNAETLPTGIVLGRTSAGGVRLEGQLVHPSPRNHALDRPFIASSCRRGTRSLDNAVCHWELPVRRKQRRKVLDKPANGQTRTIHRGQK